MLKGWGSISLESQSKSGSMSGSGFHKRPTFRNHENLAVRVWEKKKKKKKKKKSGIGNYCSGAEFKILRFALLESRV